MLRISLCEYGTSSVNKIIVSQNGQISYGTEGRHYRVNPHHVYPTEGPTVWLQSFQQEMVEKTWEAANAAIMGLRLLCRHGPTARGGRFISLRV